MSCGLLPQGLVVSSVDFMAGGALVKSKAKQQSSSAAVPSGEVEHRSSSIKAGWAQERRAAPSLPPFFADVGRSSRSCSWRPRSPSPTRPEQRREATSRATVGRPQEVLDAAFAIMKIAVASRCHLDKRRALKSRERAPSPSSASSLLGEECLVLAGTLRRACMLCWLSATVASLPSASKPCKC